MKRWQTIQDPVPLYKDGQKAIVHRVDHDAWFALGWDTEPQPQAESVPPEPTIEPPLEEAIEQPKQEQTTPPEPAEGATKPVAKRKA